MSRAIKIKEAVMANRLGFLSAMLLMSSISCINIIKAEKFKIMKAQLPLEVIIDQRDAQNPNAQFWGIKTQLPSGLAWTALPQLAVAYDPENPSEPVVLIDVKRAILKLLANNPELAQRAGISPEDFVNAGVTEDDLMELQKESLSDDEVAHTIDFIDTLFKGDAKTGMKYFFDGGVDLMTGCGKMSLGSAVLMKKAITGIIELVRSGWNEVTQ